MKKGIADLFVAGIALLSLILISGLLSLNTPTGHVTSAETVKLVRCVNNGDAFESAQNPNGCEVSGQQFVGPLGWIFKTQQTDTHVLMRCLAGGKEAFTSVDTSCEGQPPVGLIGYIYNAQQPGTVPLYRCYGGGDHLLSLQSGCEGRTNEGVVGYALTSPPTEQTLQQTAPVLQSTPTTTCMDEDGKNYYKKAYACQASYYEKYGKCEPYGITDICPDGSGTPTLREGICNAQGQPDIELIDCSKYGGICDNGACATRQTALQDYLYQIPVSPFCPSDIIAYLNLNTDFCSQQKKIVKILATYKDQEILDNKYKNYGENVNGFVCKNSDGTVTQYIFGCTAEPIPSQTASEPAATNTITLHRCVSSGDIFESLQSGCETPGQVYAGKIGDILVTEQAGTVLLKRCMASDRDAMASTDSNCEGRPFVGNIGYIYKTPRPGTAPLYRCISGGGDHYLSLRQDCMYDYGKVEMIIGHILNPQVEMVNPKYKVPTSAAQPAPSAPDRNTPQGLCAATGGMWATGAQYAVYGAGIGRQVGELGPILGYTSCDCGNRFWDLYTNLGCVEFGQARIGQGGVRYEQKPYSGVTVTEAPEPQNTQREKSPKTKSSQPRCTDTDNDNIYQAGQTTWMDDLQTISQPDFCSNNGDDKTQTGNLLFEATCNNQLSLTPGYKTVRCNCKDGACQSPPQDQPYERPQTPNQPEIDWEEVYRKIEPVKAMKIGEKESPSQWGKLLSWFTEAPTQSCTTPTFELVSKEPGITGRVTYRPPPTKALQNLLTGRSIAESTESGLVGDPNNIYISNRCNSQYLEENKITKLTLSLQTERGTGRLENVPVTCHVKPWRLESETMLEHYTVPENVRGSAEGIGSQPGALHIRKVSDNAQFPRLYDIAVVDRKKTGYELWGDLTCAYDNLIVKAKNTCNGKPKEEYLGVSAGKVVVKKGTQIPCTVTTTQYACFHNDEYTEIVGAELLNCLGEATNRELKSKGIRAGIQQLGFAQVFASIDPGCSNFVRQACAEFEQSMMAFPPAGAPTRALTSGLRLCSAAILACKLVKVDKVFECIGRYAFKPYYDHTSVDCDKTPGAEREEISINE